MCREVTNFPSLPKNGESLIVNNILIVGSSIAIVGSASGSRASATVSPISKSSKPMIAQISPACTSCTSFLPKPSNKFNSLIRDLVTVPSLLTKLTAILDVSVPR